MRVTSMNWSQLRSCNSWHRKVFHFPMPCGHNDTSGKSRLLKEPWYSFSSLELCYSSKPQSNGKSTTLLTTNTTFGRSGCRACNAWCNMFLTLFTVVVLFFFTDFTCVGIVKSLSDLHFIKRCLLIWPWPQLSDAKHLPWPRPLLPPKPRLPLLKLTQTLNESDFGLGLGFGFGLGFRVISFY